MNIYSADYNQLYKLLLPPKKRLTNFLAWAAMKVKPIQYLHDLLFVTYADGFTGLLYVAASTYAKGDRVKQDDHSVYEAIQAVPINTPPPDTTYWRKVQDIWIGFRERTKYNGQKIVLEYALNKWFGTTWRTPLVNGYAAIPDATHELYSDIYIINNTLFSDGFIIAQNAQYSDAIPKNSVYGQVGIGANYSSDQNAFTIFVPVAVYNALSADVPSREQIVRAFADKYVIAGVIYEIQTYI